MDPGTLKAYQEKLLAFAKRFDPDLGLPSRCHWCGMYLSGLLLEGDRKSVQPMAERLPGGNEQAMQQFVSDSPWDHELLLSRLVDIMLEEMTPSAGVFVIDDTSLPKKGTHSVGVIRQYCGALGKKASCQVLVSMHFAGEDLHFPLMAELYLPKEWTDDPPRMKRAGVPENKQVFREKWRIALSLLDKVKDRVPHAVTVADAGYGESREFLAALDQRAEPFIAQVCETVTFWPHDVETMESRSLRGRPRKYAGVADRGRKPCSARQWREILEQESVPFEKVALPLKHKKSTHVAAVRVREGNARFSYRPGKERWLLIERLGPQDYKYWVSNLPPETPVSRMMEWAHKRWTVEQGYQQLKEELGLDHFEGRSWPGLHHHIAMCFMAFCFLVLLQRESGGKKVDPAGGPEVPQRPVPDRAVPPLRKAS